MTADRNDQYQERFIHGEIYKARPDVMAIVHSHTPELSAFSVSSVRLRSGDRELPVYDIRKDNNGRGGIVDTAALGRSMAQSLGKDDALLLPPDEEHEENGRPKQPDERDGNHAQLDTTSRHIHVRAERRCERGVVPGDMVAYGAPGRAAA